MHQNSDSVGEDKPFVANAKWFLDRAMVTGSVFGWG